MSKNYIYKDYVRHAGHSMGGFPSHPIQQDLFLRACIARSAEHMISIDLIATCFLKYKDTPEFQEALSTSGKTPEAVARHMAGVVCKFIFHGIEDVMLVKYQGIMQRMTNPDEFWGVVAQAYREKEALDSHPTDISLVKKEIAKRNDDMYVAFITEQFNGDDLHARNQIKEMTRLLIAKQPLEPLMNMPFEGTYDVFNPKHSIFSLSDADVDRYNAAFKAEGYPSEFLEPVGIKWKEYMTFGAGNDRTEAINAVVRVLRGEASKSDYQTFEGITNASSPSRFYSELIGISHMLEQKKMDGLFDPARNLMYTVKTGSVDKQSDEVGFHPFAPLKNITRNPFQHYDHPPITKKTATAVNEEGMEQENVDTTDFTTMSGVFDPPKNLIRTLRTGNPRGEGETGFHPLAPVEYVKSNPFHHYSKEVSKGKTSYYNVPYDDVKQNVDVYNMSANDKQDLLPMGGLLDLLDPSNLFNAVRHGDPEGGSSGFNPAAPLKPSNIHKVLQKKGHRFVDGKPAYDAEAVSNANIERIMREADSLREAEQRRSLQYPSAPLHDPTRQAFPPSAPSLIPASPSLHYDTSSTSSSLYSSPASDEFETSSVESLPFHPTMRGSLPTAILNEPAASTPVASVPFRTHLYEHLGITNEHLWSSQDLMCLHKVMNILLLRMSHDDRCGVFECFIHSFAEATRQVQSEKEYTMEMPQKVHQLGIFHAVEDRDPSKSYLTVVPINLNAVAFMTYVMSGSINDRKPHRKILKKLMVALLELLKKNPTRKAHAGVRYLQYIRCPATTTPRELTYRGAYPAMTSIHNVSPIAVIAFLYHCIMLLCNYSIYAYEKMKKIEGASVFIGLPLSALRS